MALPAPQSKTESVIKPAPKLLPKIQREVSIFPGPVAPWFEETSPKDGQIANTYDPLIEIYCLAWEEAPQLGVVNPNHLVAAVSFGFVEEVETEPDAWERFTKAIKRIAPSRGPVVDAPGPPRLQHE